MSSNTVIHQIVRPVVRAIAPTKVTPNQITTLRLITAIASAVCYAKAGALWLGVGGLVFVLSMLLDRADGELARQTGQSSPGGHVYDLICDCIAGVAGFIGIGIGLIPVWGSIAVWLGVSAGLGIGVMFWQLNVWKLVELKPWRFGRFDVDPDDLMILVPILIWLGQIKPMLVAASLITPAIALWLSLAALMKQRAP